MRNWLLVFLILSCSLATNVSAESEESDPFTSAGLNLVALRNDTLDSNQDGMMDAVRVVIVINSSQNNNDLTLTLLGDHQGITVYEDTFLTFQTQENASMTYDSWSQGEHQLILEISDADGRLLKSINIGIFDLSPALSVPYTDLDLQGSQIMQTGDDCEIVRNFVDETGPRWGFSGTRSIVGTPFKVLDTDDVLDCSNWPAGDYVVTETYQNGLGQTSSDSIEFKILNMPPPNFEITTNGNEEITGTPCTIAHISDEAEDHSNYQKDWTISPQSGLMANKSVIDCSSWSAGVYKILLKVTNNEGISTTQGTMLIRLTSPQEENTSENSPTVSKGQETAITKVGLWGVVGISLILGIVVFVLMSRGPSDDFLLGNSGILDTPDSEGLPTHTDESGILWRKHGDGELDWWDRNTLSWKRW